MIYIFPPPRCLLIRGYQKLSKNHYNKSIFLLRGSPLIYQIQSIYCAVVHCTDPAGLQRGGWCSTSTLPSSLARQTQGSWHSLAGSALFVCTHPGGGFPVQSLNSQLCQDYWGDWPRMHSEAQQMVQALRECIGEKWPKSSGWMFWLHKNCAKMCTKPHVVFAEHPSVHFVKWKAFTIAASVLLDVSVLSPRPAEPSGQYQGNLREGEWLWDKFLKILCKWTAEEWKNFSVTKRPKKEPGLLWSDGENSGRSRRSQEDWRSCRGSWLWATAE